MTDDTTTAGAAERLGAIVTDFEAIIAKRGEQAGGPFTVLRLGYDRSTAEQREVDLDDLRTLLDERERLHKSAALAGSRVEAARQREETMRDAMMRACADLETLRRQLGEVETEWGLVPIYASPYQTRSTGSGDYGRAEARLQQQQYHRITTRLVGQWREAEEGGEAT